MLAPDYLDHAPDRLVLLWQQVEDDILRDVARRISKMDTLTPTAHWQLWRYQQVEAVRQDVVKKLARYTGKSEAEIRRLMQEAATRAMEAEDEIYYHYGKEPTPFADNATLQALLNAGYQRTVHIRLPPAAGYLPYFQWAKLPPGEKAAHWTLKRGGKLICGAVRSLTEAEYAALEKTHICCTVAAVSDNREPLLPHFHVEGS